MISRKLIFAFLLLAYGVQNSIGQASQSQDDLAFYCDAMANAYEDHHRVKASLVFHDLFLEELQKDNSFEKGFEELKWVSVKTASDAALRIITWQVMEDKETYRYYGYIQMADGSLTTLVDQSSEMGKITNTILDPDDWYGALYYNMVESGKGKDKYYILFGYNGYSSEEHVKVVDVLNFEGKRPVFGKSIFDNKGEKSKRIYLRYYAESNVNCNYDDETKMIIHDFIVPRVTTPMGKRIASIPDGTYVAYEKKNKEWSIIEQMETTEPINVNATRTTRQEGRDKNPLGIKKKRK